MSASDLFKMAIRNLWKRKLRTFLTVLGVIIGTASIVVMISIGLGMNKSFEAQIEEWGSLTVIEVNLPGQGRYDYMEDNTNNKLAGKDGKPVVINSATVEEFKQIPGVETATPVLTDYFMFICGKFVVDASVKGIDPESMEKMGYKIEQGRLMQEGDTNTAVFGGWVVQDFYNPKLSWRARYNSERPEVDVLNNKVAITYDQQYGTRDADKKVKPIKLEAVGVMPESGSDSYCVFMPLKLVEKIQDERDKYQKRKQGGQFYSSSNNRKKGQYESAMVKVSDMNQVKEIQEQIKEMGFSAYSLTQELESMKETTKMLRMMLGAIGAISLVVAAIGITNTMVMAIYERTREIGVMKVIGASLKDIKRLFLTEAAFIGFFGGIFGVLISMGVSKVINMFASEMQNGMLSYIPIWLYGVALLFATIIGILAGYFPANRAMHLSALSAIKTE